MDLSKVSSRIYEVRGQKVMPDYDLAGLYEVETRRLKEQVRRNMDRFPPDFMFELTREEWQNLRSQFATSSLMWGGSRYLPMAFTKQGLAMLSGILNSKKAVSVNIAVMRAFVFLRQFALSHKELTQKLKEMEEKYDLQFKDIYQALDFLITKDNMETTQKKRRKIGYKK
ncbi:MAG: ORF6N domain-containing protein [Bacteroidota bacterium]